MTPEKVFEAIKIYRERLVSLNTPLDGYPHDVYVRGLSLVDSDNLGFSPTLMHVHQMLDKINSFVVEGKMDKAFRWLGFVQGVLWTNGLYNLNELKDHNRSENISE